MSALPPSSAAEDRQALAPGTRFGELEIVRALGVGGFGIVYLARDHALEREVAIKEFMPAQLAQRGADDHVSIRASSNVKTFEIGRRSFVNEARLLARFDHRSLLKVYHFWEANGTAYMAMPYLQGQTLARYRKQLGRAPDEVWLKQLLLPLLEALQLLHSEGVFHRDVAPDNIWISADDAPPVLLDFGAARREITDRTQSFTAILKPSYAPIEQYAESTAVRQGPWTDLYALGAVLYHLLTGSAPPPATARTLADDCQPLSERDSPELAGYSKPFLRLIDWALAVRPADRPQSVADFRAVLLGQAPAPERHTPWSPPTQVSNSPYLPTMVLERSGAQPLVAEMSLPNTATAPATQPVASVGPAVAVARRSLDAPKAVRKSWPLLLGAAVVAVGLIGGVAQVLKQPELAVTAPAPALATASDARLAADSVVEPSSMASLPAAPVVTGPVAPPIAEPAATKTAPSATKVSGAGVSGSSQRSNVVTPKPTPPVVAPTQASAVAAAASAEGAASSALPSNDRFAVCSRRVFIARDWCYANECRKAANASHPECVRLRELREQRQERDKQY